MQKKITDQWLREQIEDIKPTGVNANYSADENLFALGALDSFACIQLVMRIEAFSNIVFNLEDFGGGNFKSINSLLELLRSRYSL